MVDFTQITDLTSGREQDQIPTLIPGRVLHVDADIMAYELSYKHLYMSNEKARHNRIKMDATEYLESLMYLSGSESIVCHTTPSKSTKGGRFEQARLKEYQGNRKDKVKPADVEWTREYLAKPDHGKWVGIKHSEQEADDGMCQALYQAHQEGKPHLAILTSYDKDLRMIQGLHMDWKSHDIKYVDEVGKLWDDNGKIKGEGIKWFFFQMLIGDTADNISGLPRLTNKFLQNFVHQDNKTRKHKLCGPKTAFKILEGCDTVEDLFFFVASAYKYYGEEIGFKSYDTFNEDGELVKDGEPISAKEAFLSEAYLLWMRQTELNHDFNRWIHKRGLVGLFKEVFYEQ